MAKNRLLLLSNSQNRTELYLGHAESTIKDFLGEQTKKVLFIPYARVLPSFDEFTSKVRESFQRMGYEVDPIHRRLNLHKAIREAQAIVIGGGNTFHLLEHLYERDLINSIRASVKSGIPFIGWSAGANVACPTIMTTNDMPIVQLPSFAALDLVGFQINPHYPDFETVDGNTETREERIVEFNEINPGMYVVALREGSFLRVEEQKIELTGKLGARIFIKGKEPVDYESGESLRFLLQEQKELCPA